MKRKSNMIVACVVCLLGMIVAIAALVVAEPKAMSSNAYEDSLVVFYDESVDEVVGETSVGGIYQLEPGEYTAMINGIPHLVEVEDGSWQWIAPES